MAVVALLCLLTVVGALYLQKESRVHIIFRLSHSFFPSTVRIQADDSLIFINVTTHAMWPAAGPHPTHTNYTDFDPQVGIAPWHSWVLTFTKEGTFTFHDHLAPDVRGIVISGQNNTSELGDERACTSLPETAQQAGCMEIYFRDITRTESFSHALLIFNDIAARYPASCHVFAHDLGKNAYTAYLANTLPDDIAEESSSCGFGFWHGFTTAMQADQGLDESKEFCASVGGKTNEQLQINRVNCYHGIGIGLIADPPPPNQWGSFQSLVEPAVVFCDTIAGNPDYRDRCLTGVFHAMTEYMATKRYGFVFNENSLLLCAKQKPAYQDSCFKTLVAELPRFTNFNLETTASIIKKNVPAPILLNVFEHAAIIFIDATAPVADTAAFVEKCTALGKEFRVRCTRGAVNKFFNDGIPGKEYPKAIAFCTGSWFNAQERAACLENVISYSEARYPPEIVADVCKAMPAANRTSIKACRVL